MGFSSILRGKNVYGKDLGSNLGPQEKGWEKGDEGGEVSPALFWKSKKMYPDLGPSLSLSNTVIVSIYWLNVSFEMQL